MLIDMEPREKCHVDSHPHSYSILTRAMSGEKKQKPEDLLNKLRKLEENKHCVNCGEYAKLGHTNVCGGVWGGCDLWNSSLFVVCVPQLQVGSPILLASCEGIVCLGGVTDRASQCPLGR